MALGARDAGMAPGAIRIALDAAEAVAHVRAACLEGDVVLVKASRGVELERVVDSLVGGPTGAPRP
jgi:UDP-N-acetylmuramoyl-tripeptide--D-alanyl-D-alanine ligase